MSKLASFGQPIKFSTGRPNFRLPFSNGNIIAFSNVKNGRVVKFLRRDQIYALFVESKNERDKKEGAIAKKVKSTFNRQSYSDVVKGKP